MKYSDLKKLKKDDGLKWKDCYYSLDHVSKDNDGMQGEGYTFKFSHAVKGCRNIIHYITIYKNNAWNNGNINVEEFSIVSKDEFELSKFRYEEPTTIEEAIKKFQKDIQKFQQEGDVGYYLKIPFTGPIEVELKRIIK